MDQFQIMYLKSTQESREIQRGIFKTLDMESRKYFGCMYRGRYRVILSILFPATGLFLLPLPAFMLFFGWDMIFHNQATGFWHTTLDVVMGLLILELGLHALRFNLLLIAPLYMPKFKIR